MKNFPSISIVTCSYNANISLFSKALRAIALQDYPKDKIDHIVMDGGSTNGTIELAKKYHCTVFSDKKLMNQGQVRTSLGIKKARGELIVILESDNIIVGRDWFKKMVQPFAEDKKIVCTFSAYNSYEKNMSATAKYAALFGSPEPTLYYLKKSEKIRMDQTQYDKGHIIKNNKNYWTVTFTKKNLPTLGDNGHMFLRSAMNKVNKDPEKFVHVDAFKELLDKGYDTFGVVKNKIIHVTEATPLKLIKQRVGMKRKFFDGRRGKRSYLVMDWKSPYDRFHLAQNIFYSLTFVVPLYESLRGYIKIREAAWFLHPIMCFLMVLGYGLSEIQWAIKKKI